MGKHFQQLLEILDRDECGRRRGALGDWICAFVDLAGRGGNPTVREGARARLMFSSGIAGRMPAHRRQGITLLSDQALPLADSRPTSASDAKYRSAPCRGECTQSYRAGFVCAGCGAVQWDYSVAVGRYRIADQHRQPDQRCRNLCHSAPHSISLPFVEPWPIG